MTCQTEDRWLGGAGCLLVWAMVGCASHDNGAPAITAVDPATVTTMVTTPAVIHGHNFFALASAEVGTDDPPQVDERWQVQLGAIGVAAEAVSLVDSESIEIVVPAGIAPGIYDVTVTAPDGRAATLAGGLTVVADPIGLEVSIETAPGGAGVPVGAEVMAAGTTLALYAVVRNEGAFVAEVEVDWSVSAPIGSFVGDPASATTFTAEQVGTGEIGAAHPVAAGDTTGAIEVVAGPATSIGVEDAGGGAGSPVGEVTLTTDDHLPLFAVARDGYGNFVANQPATWSVTGSIGSVEPGPSASADFDPTTPNSGTVDIAHATLSATGTGVITVLPGAAAAIAVSPDTLVLDADADPYPFTVTGTDADGNPTTDLGVVGWSIGSGPITAIDAVTGWFTPTVAGTGTVRADTSYALFAVSGAVVVVPGQAFALTVSPDTATTVVGGAEVDFDVTAVDGDGNATADLGGITWSIPGDLFAAIDPATGVLTPTSAGAGTVRATSGYGPWGDSGAVTVHGGLLVVTSVRAPLEVVKGETRVRVEVEVTNYTGGQASLTGAWLSFGQGAVDLDGDYQVVADYRNRFAVGAGAAVTLVFWVDVSGAPAGLGTVDVVATVEGWLTLLGLRVVDSNATAWEVLDTTGPVAVISEPVPDANRICVGDTVDFSALGSTGSAPLWYLWSFSAGDPATAAIRDPLAIGYDALGAFPYQVTVGDSLGRTSTALGVDPVYVGSLEAAADQYATGAVLLERPVDGENIDMSSLPSNDYIDLPNGSHDLRQCDGSAISSSGECYLTFFVDRGVLDTSRDVPSLPGVQFEMHECDHVNDVGLSNTVPRLEGPALVYAEFRKEPEGVVTASGFVGFNMVDDTERPTVSTTLPLADCGASCFGKGWRWLLGFSEPMDAASLLAATVVEYSAAAICGGGVWTDITATSSRSYDAASRTLRVTPAVQSLNNYSVRVTVGVGATDSSSNLNQVAAPFVRCGVVEDRGALLEPAAPIVTVSPDPLSPDGDGVADATTFTATVDDRTTAVRLEIWHGLSDVITLVRPVSVAGTYALIWDGRDNTGRVVPDGYYAYRVMAENGLGLPSPDTPGVVLVDSAVSFIGVPPRL